jgi:hypothetical protein
MLVGALRAKGRLNFIYFLSQRHIPYYHKSRYFKREQELNTCFLSPPKKNSGKLLESFFQIANKSKTSATQNT